MGTQNRRGVTAAALDKSIRHHQVGLMDCILAGLALLVILREFVDMLWFAVQALRAFYLWWAGGI
jgi:hypothetical protein